MDEVANITHSIIMPEQCLIRAMRLADIDFVMALEHEIYTVPWARQIFMGCQHSGYFSWVLEYSNEIIGYIVVALEKHECQVLNIAIAPNWQSNGLGQFLFNEMLKQVQHQHGITECVLEVKNSNEKAKNLYRSLGFNIVGKRKSYYPTPRGREDALLLRLKIKTKDIEHA